MNMKYQKANVEVVKFDDYLEFMTRSMGGWQCGEVTVLTGEQAIAIGGDGYGVCGGFAYSSSRTYYSCIPIQRNGYSASLNCSVWEYNQNGCHVVN